MTKEYPMTTLKPSDMLLRNIPNERLEEMYGDEDYYWYLKSPEFTRVFLKTIASRIHTLILKRINTTGDTHLKLNVLDVGCGEGWLANVLDNGIVNYVGIEGSLKALEKAAIRYPHSLFLQTRIEEATKYLFGKFDLIVFGGILDVLIKPEHHINFINMYCEAYQPSHFIIYDLQRLNTTTIDTAYNLVSGFRGEVTTNLKLPTVKTKRQIKLYQCEKELA